MVRLEKLLWEQIVNIKALGRARQMGAPAKWFPNSPIDEVTVSAHERLNGPLGPLWRSIESLYSSQFWKFMYERITNRGLAFEDYMVTSSDHLRRSSLYQIIGKQSFHPYQWVLFKRRRARYYKVERTVRGFIVPDYIKDEARSRTAAETFENRIEMQNFLHREFFSDMTPAGGFSRLGKLIALEGTIFHGLLDPQAWDRYFYNEIDYNANTREEIEKAKQALNWGNFNLNTSEGRSSFEAAVKRHIELYPGHLVKQGQEFDFNAYYARRAIESNQDTSKFDTKLVEDLKRTIAEKNKPQEDTVEKKKLGKYIGKTLPDFLRPKAGKGLQASQY